MLIAALLLSMAVLPAMAQREHGFPKWGVGGTFGSAISAPPGVEGQGPKAVPKGGACYGLYAEYYMPFSPFSLRAGWDGENLDYFDIGGDSDLSQLSIGARYYPAPATWAVQPRLGADLLYTMGRVTTPMKAARENMGTGEFTERQGVFRDPFVSLSPTVGIELRTFSSLSFTIDYAYRIGVGSKIDVESKSNMPPGGYRMKGAMNRHCISIGMKADFPFRWETEDSGNLVEGIIELIIEALSGRD